jgi:hypothetical protein
MNFFFGLKFDELKCLLTIPKFTNENNYLKDVCLFSAKVYKNSWLIQKQICEQDNNFFYLNISSKQKNDIFFIAKNNLLKNKNTIRVNELSSFYKVKMSFLNFRSNLKIYNKIGEFSSYQAEYPLEMCERTGSILTPISSFVNQEQNNIAVFKQIYYLPVKKTFFVYILDLLTKKVLKKQTFYTNSTNIINLSKLKQIKNCCIYSEDYLGIPIFISYGKKRGISMEHSHPPQIYLLSKNKFKVISNLKRKVKEIVSKST